MKRLALALVFLTLWGQEAQFNAARLQTGAFRYRTAWMARAWVKT